MNLKVAFSLIIFSLLANGQYWKGDLHMQSTFIADVAGSSNITLEWASGYEANATLWFFTPLSSLSNMTIPISNGYEILSSYQQQYGLRRATYDSSVLIIHQLSNVTEGTYICRSHGILGSSLLLTIPFPISMEPLFGPIAGGTNITILGSATFQYLSRCVGSYLPEITGVGNVSIGSDLSATTVSLLPNGSSAFNFVAVTPSTTESSIGQPLDILIELSPSPIRINFKRTFTYMPNPEITSISPNNFIVTGGTLLDVTGKSLSSVAKPIIQLTVIITRAAANNSTSNTSTTSTSMVCALQPGNDTYMQCPMPPLNIPADFLEILDPRYNTSASRRRRNIRLSLNSHRRLSRMKRNTNNILTVYGPNGDDRADFYLGFILDGYKEYENINNAFPNITFLPCSSPEINSSNEVIEFDPSEEDLIDVKGKYMMRGCLLRDYVVHIGNQICINIVLQDNQLSCRPPKEKPSSTSNDAIYCEQHHLSIAITLGTKQYHYACLTYTDRSATKTFALIVGLTVGLAGLALFLTILIVCIITCRRRKGSHEIERHQNHGRQEIRISPYINAEELEPYKNYGHQGKQSGVYLEPNDDNLTSDA